jgi:hypothetical protein
VGAIVRVNDRMQTGYRYRLSVAVGRGFHPGFTPLLQWAYDSRTM